MDAVLRMQPPRPLARLERPRLAAAPAVLALGAVLLWSTNAVVGGSALRALTVPQLLFVQFACAAALLGVHKRVARPGAAHVRLTWRAGLLACVGVTGTMTLQYVGFANAPLVQANVVAYAWPLVVAVVLAVTVRTRGSLAVAGLAGAGFAGVGLMLAGAGSDPGAAGNPLVGYLAAGGSAAAMASFTLGARWIADRQADALLLATCVGAAGALAMALLDGTPWPGGTGWLPAIYLGVGPMAAGYLLWSRAMASPQGRRCAPLAYATPLLSTLLLLLAGHPIAPVGLLGAGLVLASIAGVLRQSRVPD